MTEPKSSETSADTELVDTAILTGIPGGVYTGLIATTGALTDPTSVAEVIDQLTIDLGALTALLKESSIYLDVLVDFIEDLSGDFTWQNFEALSSVSEVVSTPVENTLSANSVEVFIAGVLIRVVLAATVVIGAEKR